MDFRTTLGHRFRTRLEFKKHDVIFTKKTTSDNNNNEFI